jgi:hypothetical protein
LRGEEGSAFPRASEEGREWMMQRGSDKHGPLADEQLKDEIEPLERGAPVSARVEEFRDPEGAGDREPEPDARLTVDEAELRSSIARWLHRVDYPAPRDTLVAEAERNNAPLAVIDALRRLPADVYENVQQIWIALGGAPEERF